MNNAYCLFAAVVEIMLFYSCCGDNAATASVQLLFLEIVLLMFLDSCCG